jgi:transcription initiation factor TFIID subunit 2
MTFLLGLLKYNDNSANRYSDDHYRAALIRSLTNTLSVIENPDTDRMDFMTSDVEEIVSEVTRAFNKDITNPSYCRVVASACLKSILDVSHSY